MDESKKVEERQQFWSVRNARQMTSLRSTQQYYSWKNQLGFFIHPKVEINVEPDQLSIADIGTGTGTWLFDLAKKLHPPVKLHGFDIDTSLAPPPAWLPENVTIQAVENYTDKFPTHLTQAYDIVHVSNIASSIKDNNPGANQTATSNGKNPTPLTAASCRGWASSHYLPNPHITSTPSSASSRTKKHASPLEAG
ncbi:MAG: hypothetical protein L6R41_008467 [Letrouitia leprolyta]|nr:MAG: hypothetical protein L6R41_008467 [Letrouitia leprolyta]